MQRILRVLQTLFERLATAEFRRKENAGSLHAPDKP